MEHVQCIHASTYTQTHTHTHKHTHTHTHTQTNIHTHKKHKHTQTNIHIRIQANTNKHTYTQTKTHTIIYRLIATGTITFSNQKGAVIKQGWPLNLCRVPEQRHLYGNYVSDITQNIFQIARTCS